MAIPLYMMNLVYAQIRTLMTSTPVTHSFHHKITMLYSIGRYNSREPWKKELGACL